MPPHTLPVSSARASSLEINFTYVSVDLVGSTLSDPYISYSAALFALAGPLHGCVLMRIQSNTSFLMFRLVWLIKKFFGGKSLCRKKLVTTSLTTTSRIIFGRHSRVAKSFQGNFGFLPCYLEVLTHGT